MTLTKPFDTAPLLAGLKVAGAPALEGGEKAVIPVIFDWLESSIAMLSPAVSAIATPVLELIKEQIISKLPS